MIAYTLGIEHQTLSGEAEFAYAGSHSSISSLLSTVNDNRDLPASVTFPVLTKDTGLPFAVGPLTLFRIAHTLTTCPAALIPCSGPIRRRSFAAPNPWQTHAEQEKRPNPAEKET